MQPACEWDTGCKVYTVSMSPLASTHCLVAAACDDHMVRLCDPQSGAMAHTLNGHKVAAKPEHAVTLPWPGRCTDLLSGLLFFGGT